MILPKGVRTNYISIKALSCSIGYGILAGNTCMLMRLIDITVWEFIYNYYPVEYI